MSKMTERGKKLVKNSRKQGENTVWDKFQESSWRKFWRKIQGKPDPELKELESRKLFTYALALCELEKDLDRLEMIFTFARKMQRVRGNKGGNFKWRWKDTGIKDTNAVEFCMRGAAQLYIYHKDRIRSTSQAAWETLEQIVKDALEACQRHARSVPEDYTNIFLMNAMNLILLGHALNRKTAAKEGLRRLEKFCLYTWEWGIHEYCSPTYSGIQLYCLGLIEKFCDAQLKQPTYTLIEENEDKLKKARCQARLLIELIWCSIAQNQVSSKDHIGGAFSRKIGHYPARGGKNDILGRTKWAAGWIKGGKLWDGLDEVRGIYPTLGMVVSPDTLKEDALPLPRLVNECWGPTVFKSRNGRSHYICDGITLSTASSAYDRRGDKDRKLPAKQNLPFTVDFPTLKHSRCYFVPDAVPDPSHQKQRRHPSNEKIEPRTAQDPYGTGDRKKHHPPLLWAAAQREGDALGLALYDPGEYNKYNELASYFVMPEPDGGDIWIDGSQCSIDQVDGSNLHPGSTLAFRIDSAAVGVKVIWTYTFKGESASIKLENGKWDAAKFKDKKTLNLKVCHRQATDARGGRNTTAGIAFWVRIGCQIESSRYFESWYTNFQRNQILQPTENPELDPKKNVDIPKHLHFAVEGQNGQLSLDVRSPAGRRFVTQIKPGPRQALLEVDGQDIGRPILAQMDLVQKYEQELYDAFRSQQIRVAPDSPQYWRAERGRVCSPMKKVPKVPTHTEPGEHFVWMPRARLGGSEIGSVAWILDIERDADYYIWGAINAPTRKNDSFHIRISQYNGEPPLAGMTTDPLYLAAWHTGTTDEGGWGWKPLRILNEDGTDQPSPLHLEGRIKLQLFAREHGIKIDRLFITDDPHATPV